MLTLNDERYGMSQTFATAEEMDAEVAKCAREWWRATDTSMTESEYVAECQAEARKLATEITTAKSLESLNASDAMIEAAKLAKSTDQDWEIGATTYTFADDSALQISGLSVKALTAEEIDERN